MTSSQWLGDVEAKPAPEPLRSIQALINTIDLESGRDRLATIADARPWLVAHQLLSPDASPDPDDLRLVAAVREGLRALVRLNSNGPAPDSSALAALRTVSDAGSTRPVVGADGRVTLVSDGSSIQARLSTLLLVVRDAQVDGSWSHLKACANDDCLWAFYDRSRNHGGTWCDMSSCGNKLKNRDFRARRREGG